MPLVQTRGAASAQGFGEFAQAASSAVNYIEDVFSTYLYTGTGANLTITNNIDLSTNGGLVWIKNRSAVASHRLFDTARGATNYLTSSGLPGSATDATSLTAFNSTGFSLGDNSAGDDTVNGSTYKYASWSFRKQSKFFDIQTWTGDGANRTISHSLGSVPACILVKRTSSGNAAWAVYHRSLANTQYLVLNDTAAAATGATWWNSTTPTSSVFSLGTDATVNESGKTYIAYIFAHDAGGFGLTGTDNVISCGSFTGTGSDLSVNLGYEPQWLLVKRASSGTENWAVYDNMRGMFVNYDDNILFPNTSGAEVQVGRIAPTATGFSVTSSYPASGTTYIYIAIRRGPMKVPTTGTSVFSPNYQTASTGTAITTNFPPDLQLYRSTAQSSNEGVAVDRLRGVNTTTTANSTPWLDTTTTAAEASASSVTRSWGNTGFQMPGFVATIPSVFYSFRRAPSFFDEVCYTGSGADPQTVSHNLGVAPELMIFKARDVAAGWRVWGGNMAITEYLALSETSAVVTGSTFFGSTLPTSTSFYVGSGLSVAARTIVAYLFATAPGVSKVGSYTGTGALQTVNCGFTGGARFVLIKRTDSTGDWYVWDSARGITSGNDPYLLLNSTAAEVTNTDYVDTANSGFEISSTAPAAINANGGTFIFLAIA